MISYGTPNSDYVRTWRQRPDDQPMWALNLMRYRPMAQYADGRPTTLTGWQADDAYSPHEELAAVGAASVLRAAVVHQLIGDGARWDRVAVAKYPSRCAQLDMQRSPDFQERHAHKVAGMEFTIVLATFLPPLSPPPSANIDAAPMLLLQVVADAAAPDLAADIDAVPIATFDVEDTIIGDTRKYAQARWHAISAAVADQLRSRPRIDDPVSYALVLAPERSALDGALRG